MKKSSLSPKIVFEDEFIMVVNKPPGLLVVPTPKNEGHTLTSILNHPEGPRRTSPRGTHAYGARVGFRARAYPCHRLDRDTSGLIIYAKKRDIQDKMADAFRQRKVKKRYIGFAQGFLKKHKGQINKRIEGKESLTYYRVLKKSKEGFSIVELEPVTGRTNQIRIHMKILGHPLVGERKFAFGKDFRLKFRRCCLHAQYIEFNHPATGKRISFYADLPQDMKNFQKNFSKNFLHFDK